MIDSDRHDAATATGETSLMKRKRGANVLTWGENIGFIALSLLILNFATGIGYSLLQGKRLRCLRSYEAKRGTLFLRGTGIWSRCLRPMTKKSEYLISTTMVLPMKWISHIESF